MTLRGCLASARDALVAAGIDAPEASRDAALLARLALGWDAASLLTHEPDPAPEGFDTAFNALIARRTRREPVAYIRGTQEFWGRDFVVSPAVLIPRPETELIIEEALGLEAWVLRAPDSRWPSIADIGTGSGCLAVTLAAELPGARVVATDLSGAALDVARANAARHAVADRIEFREGAYLAGASGPFDLIVSNPPYITESDYASLAPEVRSFEPALALASGPDGLRDIREILVLAGTALAPGGVLLMEIGYGQDAALHGLVAAVPSLRLLRIRNDLQGIPRTVVATRR